MLTIRKKISRLFLTFIILIPLTILFLFNFIVSIYSQTQAKEDLLESVSEISSSLNSNLPNTNLSKIPGQNVVNEDLPNMAALLNNQNHSPSVELVVFNKNGELSRVFNTASFVSDDLAQLIYTKSQDLVQGEIGSVKFGNDTYYIVEVDYQTQTMTDKILYISKGLIIDEFVMAINIVLVIVSILVTLIAFIISNKVSKAFARPIELLTTQVETMKTEELLIIDNKSDSLELQKLTNEINALNHRIYHHNQAQKNFLNNASHELRTPLMNIQGYSDGISMGIFEDAKGTSHLISEQCKKLTDLVDSLLTLSRTENFNTNVHFENMCLSENLIDLINKYNGYALSKHIKIITDIEPDLYINSNIELLFGSIGNIISNAIRYAKTTVTISLIQNNQKAIITIKDDGNGIEDISHIFDRFYKGKNGNYGLGLSIAKAAVEVMKAEIRVKNDYGALFEILIDLTVPHS